jgi:hypothetical protein
MRIRRPSPKCVSLVKKIVMAAHDHVIALATMREQAISGSVRCSWLACVPLQRD